MAPALTTITIELHMSQIDSVMALSIYILAAAFGPLVIGPLSEVYGRQKILHASNVWFFGVERGMWICDDEKGAHRSEIFGRLRREQHLCIGWRCIGGCLEATTERQKLGSIFAHTAVRSCCW